LEKVTADTKLKKFEEELAQHETINAKVRICSVYLTALPHLTGAKTSVIH